MAATEDFDSFYAAAFARLVGQLALVTGDLHEAEDVVQEAMARAASRWAQLRAYDAPEAWVRRVAFNLAVSGHWRTRRRLAALLRLGPPAPVPPVSVEALALAEALQDLTLAHRQVIVLYYLADLPVEQVAHDAPASPSETPSISPRAAAGAPRVAVSRLGSRAVGISWPTSARQLAAPMPRTPGVSQRSLVSAVGRVMPGVSRS